MITISIILSVILCVMGIILLILDIKGDDPFNIFRDTLFTVLGLTCAVMLYLHQKKSVNDSYESTIIELPEEYKQISRETPIIGYFDKDSVLHIEFDNSLKHNNHGN